MPLFLKTNDHKIFKTRMRKSTSPRDVQFRFSTNQQVLSFDYRLSVSSLLDENAVQEEELKTLAQSVMCQLYAMAQRPPGETKKVNLTVLLELGQALFDIPENTLTDDEMEVQSWLLRWAGKTARKVAAITIQRFYRRCFQSL